MIRVTPVISIPENRINRLLKFQIETNKMSSESKIKESVINWPSFPTSVYAKYEINPAINRFLAYSISTHQSQ